MDFKALTRDETRTALLAAHDPILLIHRKPDGDAVGSAAALAHFYLARGERVSIDCADAIPARLAFITKELNLTPTTDKETRTIISLDVASPAQLGSLYEVYTGEAAPDLMIDHHAVGTPFAPHFIIPDLSSTGEVLYGLMHFPTIDPAAEVGAVAEGLYTAISSDTGCFRYANVTADTLHAAAELLTRGVDAANINHLLFDSKSHAQLKAEALALSHMETAARGKIAYSCIPCHEITALGYEFFDTAIDVIRTVEGAEIALVLKETPGNIIRGSLRSTGADVASVAMQFNGGGHVRAAGFTLSDLSLEDAVKTVLPLLETLV